MPAHTEFDADTALPIPCAACWRAVVATARITESGATTGWCWHIGGRERGALMIATCEHGRITGVTLETCDRQRAARMLAQSCQTQDAMAEAAQASMQ